MLKKYFENHWEEHDDSQFVLQKINSERRILIKKIKLRKKIVEVQKYKNMDVHDYNKKNNIKKNTSKLKNIEKCVVTSY